MAYENSVYEYNENGELCVRVIGASGGGDQHNLGWYATQSALESAYPTATDGDWAIVGSTDTVWVWDSDNNEWKDTDQKGQVESVNGKTGVVVLNASDVGAIPQYSQMPEPNQAGDIVQYVGETTENYTNGYFYKSSAEYSDPVATISQTVGSGLTDLSVDVDKFIETEQPTQSGNTSFVVDVVPDTSVVEDATAGLDYTFDGQTVINYFNNIWGYHSPNMDTYVWGITYAVYTGGGINGWVLSRNQDGSSDWSVALPDGLTINSTPNLGDYIAIRSTKGETIWSKNGTTVDLMEYGISYSGVPNDGDMLSVAYTAPTVIGYSWNNIEVQPANAGGGIDWKTSVDYPENVTGVPIFTIPGGLEDGVYEFYYQVKLANYNRAYPNYFMTYKICFKLENGNAVYANVSYVIDGDTYTIERKLSSTTIGSDWFVYGQDIKMRFEAYQFGTNFRNFGIQDEIKDCYKISAIKNVGTGEEYIATTGEIDTGYPTGFDSTISVLYLFTTLQQEPQIPAFYSWTDFTFDEAKYIYIEKYVSGDLNVTPGLSKLYYSMYARGKGFFSMSIDMRAGEYVATIHKATGVFENTAILKSSSGYIWIQVNAPVGESGRVYAQVSGIGDSGFYVNVYSTPPDEQTEPLNINKVGGNITETNFGEILQYKGATNANYTNGYFYKASGTPVLVPTELVCTPYSEPYLQTDITCSDADALIALLMTHTGWDYDMVCQNLMNAGFSINPNTNYVYWSAYGSWTDANIVALFTFSPVPSSTIGFNTTLIGEHTEIQNQSWQQVDVQPSSGGGSTSATATLSEMDWTNDSQTVNVQGVTASNNVIVAPAPSSQTDYTDAGVKCTAQGAGTLTFTCDTTPTSALTVNVLII